MSFRKKGLKAEHLNLRQIISLLAYRRPMEVTDIDVCPRCKRFGIDADYQRYCSSCGQRLNWDIMYRQISLDVCTEHFKNEDEEVDESFYIPEPSVSLEDAINNPLSYINLRLCRAQCLHSHYCVGSCKTCIEQQKVKPVIDETKLSYMERRNYNRYHK